MSYVERAAPFVGVPYALFGANPVTGWDCLGLVRDLRARLFSRQTPPWADYDEDDFASPRRAADLIREALPAWREVRLSWASPGRLAADPPPGCALLLRRLGYAAHVGLALDCGQFIHAEPGTSTTIQPLRPRWEARIIAAYEYDPPD